MAASVYESIGEVAIRVTIPDEDGGWADPTAAVRLDEQGRVAARIDQGTAPRPLLGIPDEGIFSGTTFEPFIALFEGPSGGPPSATGRPPRARSSPSPDPETSRPEPDR